MWPHCSCTMALAPYPASSRIGSALRRVAGVEDSTMTDKITNRIAAWVAGAGLALLLGLPTPAQSGAGAGSDVLAGDGTTIRID